MRTARGTVDLPAGVGRVIHSCGRRMIGDSRKGRPTYYLCRPRKNNRGGADPHADLPTAVRIREDELLDAVGRFFADRIFGPDRTSIPEADLATVDDSASNGSSPTSNANRKLSSGKPKTAPPTTHSRRR